MSQQISKLEEELGIRLFDRTTRSVRLTQAGADFAVYASEILTQVGRAKQAVREHLSLVRGEINLGCIPVIACFQLTSLVASFRKEHPGVKISLHEAECADLERMLQSSEVDAAILGKGHIDSSLAAYPLVEDEMVIVASSSHPFAKQGTIDLREARDEKFILLPRNSGLYSDCVAACRNAGFEPDVALTCTHVETVLGLVAEGVGISILSSKVASFFTQAGLATVRLSPRAIRRITLVVPKGRPLSRPVEAFVKHALVWRQTHCPGRHIYQ